MHTVLRHVQLPVAPHLSSSDQDQDPSMTMSSGSLREAELDARLKAAVAEENHLLALKGTSDAVNTLSHH